jgi:hypothetical protein
MAQHDPAAAVLEACPSYGMVRDLEIERLAVTMRGLCEHYLARRATVKDSFSRAYHQDEPPNPLPEP